MDPTACLTDIRELLDLRGQPGALSEMADHVADLDEWMSKGGFPPAQWQKPDGRRPLTEPGVILEGVEHGKRRSYDKGCRCLACRAANRFKRNLTSTEMKEYDDV